MPRRAKPPRKCSAACAARALKALYPDERDDPASEPCQRLEYELDVISHMGYVDYFLIVWDFIHYAKSHGIMVGPGRGSGAGSIVAYCPGHHHAWTP